MNIIKKAEDKIKDSAKCIKNQYSSAEKEVKENTKKYIKKGDKLIKEIFNNFKQQIRNKPVTFLLLSAATGFVIGLITRKKK